MTPVMGTGVQKEIHGGGGVSGEYNGRAAEEMDQDKNGMGGLQADEADKQKSKRQAKKTEGSTAEGED